MKKLLFAFVLLGCQETSKNIACYSGGGIFWRGTSKGDVNYYKDGFISFTDKNTGEKVKMRGDCYVETHHEEEKDAAKVNPVEH